MGIIREEGRKRVCNWSIKGRFVEHGPIEKIIRAERDTGINRAVLVRRGSLDDPLR